jgi:hypothetical protein
MEGEPWDQGDLELRVQRACLSGRGDSKEERARILSISRVSIHSLPP